MSVKVTCLYGTSTRCTHTYADKAPRRRTCEACGARLVVTAGSWGVFVHDSSGRYPRSAAVEVVYRMATADAHAAALGPQYVARFLPADA